MAGFESKQKVIAGKKFTVSPLPFGRGKAGLLRLLAVIAPSVGDALARGASVTALLSDARGAAFIGNALAGLPHRLDDATMAWFENEFGSKSKAEIGDADIEMKLETQAQRDTVFESLGYMAFFEWLAFCLEVNYSNFFTEALAGLGSRKPKAEAVK